MSKYTNADIRTDMDWDTHDAWGSVQSALFDLCDAWYLAEDAILPGYRPSSLIDHESLTWRARAWRGFMEQGDITSDQVIYWFTVLTRMSNLVKAAGRDY
jgi:hypothetical protein